jgi:hypothetical protein
MPESEMEERRKNLIERRELTIEAQKRIISILKIMELNCLLEFKYCPYGFETKTPFLAYIRDILEGSIKLRVLASPFNLDGNGLSFPFSFLRPSIRGPVIYVQDRESKNCLHYIDLLELRQVPLFDLPLYMDWAWKSQEFSKLLSGSTNKGNHLDRIIKKGITHLITLEIFNGL